MESELVSSSTSLNISLYELFAFRVDSKGAELHLE